MASDDESCCQEQQTAISNKQPFHPFPFRLHLNEALPMTVTAVVGSLRKIRQLFRCDVKVMKRRSRIPRPRFSPRGVAHTRKGLLANAEPHRRHKEGLLGNAWPRALAATHSIARALHSPGDSHQRDKMLGAAAQAKRKQSVSSGMRTKRLQCSATLQGALSGVQLNLNAIALTSRKE